MTGARRLRVLPLAALLCLTAVLGGCSLVKLGYDHADTLVRWQLDDYVEFNDTQEQLYQRRFDKLWNWHRHTQLPLYATDLRDIADAVAKPVTQQQVEGWIARAEQHGSAIMDRLQQPAEALLRSLSDRQVTALLQALAHDRHKMAKKLAEHSEVQRRRKNEEHMRDSVENWLGSITDAQRQRIHAWALQWQPTARLDLELLRARTPLIAAALADRHRPDFDARLQAVFAEKHTPVEQQLDRIQKANQAAWVSLLVDLSHGLSTEQRTHLQNRLRRYARDFTELSKEPGES